MPPWRQLAYPGSAAEVDASVGMVADLLREQVTQTHDERPVNLTNVDVRVDAARQKRNLY